MSGPTTWAPAGQPVAVAGRRITAGLFYVGHLLRATIGAIEPALVNPLLPVDPVGTRITADPGSSPAYHLLSAAHRATYLDWLAGGRRARDLPLGLVLLFCSGLERRALVDAAEDGVPGAEARRDLPAIATEVRRLGELFGPAHPSFQDHANAFLDVLELLGARARHPAGTPWPQPPPVPQLSPNAQAAPIRLRVVLAQCANAALPVPPDWARAWAWYHPGLFPSTPQTRCAEEFTRLFLLRLRRRQPSGVVPPTTGRSPIRVGFRPVNPGMETMTITRPDLPDVLEDPGATRILGALADEVTSALTPYSRWIARTPGGRDSVASTMLLPADLLEDDPGPLRPLVAWSERLLSEARRAGTHHAVVETTAFAPYWCLADPAGRMSRDEATGLAQVLDRIGVGLEPDVRFGAPAPPPGPVVLFPLRSHDAVSTVPDPDQATRASPGFQTADRLLSIAAATVLRSTVPTGAGGRSGEHTLSGDLVNRAMTSIAAEITLPVAERARLGARLRWLLASQPALARARRGAARLTEAERRTGGQFLVRLATAAGALGPQQVTALAEGFRLLSLPVDEVHRLLHAALASGLDAAAPSGPSLSGRQQVPVVVRNARPAAAGHALPWAAARRPADGGTDGATDGGTDGAAVTSVHLRRSVIELRLHETQAVTALLAEIFTDTDTDTDEITDTDTDEGAGNRTGTGPPGGLDAAHRALLAEAAARPHWTPAEFATLAVSHGVLPSGALETINDAAIQLSGLPAIEGCDDLLEVDGDLAAEVLR